jgi:hypothetical protein
MLKIAILTLFVIAHPVHVSLMSVEHAEKTDVFNVFLKLYSDDFILDYRLLSGDTTKLNFGEINEKTELLVLKYLDARIQIFADGKKLEGKLIKLDSSEGELKMDMVFSNKKRSGSYLVKNFIMTDLYPDQCNLLIFRYGDYEEGVKLTPEKQDHIFKVN